MLRVELRGDASEGLLAFPSVRAEASTRHAEPSWVQSSGPTAARDTEHKTLAMLVFSRRECMSLWMRHYSSKLRANAFAFIARLRGSGFFGANSMKANSAKPKVK